MGTTITRAVRAFRPGQAGHGELLGFMDVLPTLRELQHRPTVQGDERPRLVVLHLATDWVHAPRKRMREGYGFIATALWTASGREQLQGIGYPYNFRAVAALDPQAEPASEWRLPLMGVLLVLLLPVLGLLAGLAMGAWANLQRVPAHLLASVGVALAAGVVVLCLVRVALDGSERDKATPADRPGPRVLPPA